MPRDLDALLDVFHAASEAVEFVRGMTRCVLRVPSVLSRKRP